eukprot:CAMPEP_0170528872 /NCGR_PEP_ID=MMETSP0209-20121228/14301_1 /TAXON_ID=665100 ORGANISM="Litonotus pictus, Strain P1" /NCGR_SAMPLE_ID=MMETSP0209 /ASSEMBLY_ACC=CAM_ASM_000301 /LENGTH=692 /DNA_ID=CAMNT_0010820293 /DNA_START=1 /DNA_END=2076 /DNA_ORIENTATION=+
MKATEKPINKPSTEAPLKTIGSIQLFLNTHPHTVNCLDRIYDKEENNLSMFTGKKDIEIIKELVLISDTLRKSSQNPNEKNSKDTKNKAQKPLTKGIEIPYAVSSSSEKSFLSYFQSSPYDWVQPSTTKLESLIELLPVFEYLSLRETVSCILLEIEKALSKKTLIELRTEVLRSLIVSYYSNTESLVNSSACTPYRSIAGVMIRKVIQSFDSANELNSAFEKLRELLLSDKTDIEKVGILVYEALHNSSSCLAGNSLSNSTRVLSTVYFNEIVKESSFYKEQVLSKTHSQSNSKNSSSKKSNEPKAKDSIELIQQDSINSKSGLIRELDSQLSYMLQISKDLVVDYHSKLSIEPKDQSNEELSQRYESITKSFTEQIKTIFSLNNPSASSEQSTNLYKKKQIDCNEIKTYSNNGNVRSLCVIKEGVFVSGSYDGKIRIFDLNQVNPFGEDNNAKKKKEDKCVATLEYHSNIVTTLCKWDDNTFISGSWDHTIRTWDVKWKRNCATIQVAGRSIESVRVLNKELFLSGTDDNNIKVWDFTSRKCVRTLEGHASSVFSLCVLSEDSFVSGSKDKTIKVWNVSSNNGKCVSTLEGFTDVVYCICKVDEDRIIAGSEFFTLKVLSLSRRKCTGTLIGHSDLVKNVCTVGENIVASGSMDTTIKIWDITGNCCLHTIQRSYVCLSLSELSPPEKRE